jgi:hypothetical protein
MYSLTPDGGSIAAMDVVVVKVRFHLELYPTLTSRTENRSMLSHSSNFSTTRKAENGEKGQEAKRKK